MGEAESAGAALLVMDRVSDSEEEGKRERGERIERGVAVGSPVR